MGGWLDLTQQGLSPCKKYRASWRSSAKSYRIIWPVCTPVPIYLLFIYYLFNRLLSYIFKYTFENKYASLSKAIQDNMLVKFYYDLQIKTSSLFNNKINFQIYQKCPFNKNFFKSLNLAISPCLNFEYNFAQEPYLLISL